MLISFWSNAFLTAIMASVFALATSRAEVDLIQNLVSKFMELSPNA